MNSSERFARQLMESVDQSSGDLLARIEEIERRLRNMNVAGVVDAINPDGKSIRVKFGDRKTGWIKWIATAAGEIADYRCPSVGEQCLLLNYGGGVDSNQVWALCGVPSDAFPLPGSDPAKRIVKYGAGVLETIENSGTVTTKASVKINADVPEFHGTGEVSDKKRTLTADRAIFDGHKHLEKGDGALTDVPNNKQG